MSNMLGRVDGHKSTNWQNMRSRQDTFHVSYPWRRAEARDPAPDVGEVGSRESLNGAVLTERLRGGTGEDDVDIGMQPGSGDDGGGDPLALSRGFDK